MFSHDPVIQAVAGLACGVLVAGLLVWSDKRGMRLTGFSFRDLMTHANDELTIKYFDRHEKANRDEGRAKETGKPGPGDAVTEGA